MFFCIFCLNLFTRQVGQIMICQALMDYKIIWHNCSPHGVVVTFETLCPGRLKVKVTLEGQIIK